MARKKFITKAIVTKLSRGMFAFNSKILSVVIIGTIVINYINDGIQSFDSNLSIISGVALPLALGFLVDSRLLYKLKKYRDYFRAMMIWLICNLSFLSLYFYLHITPQNDQH